MLVSCAETVDGVPVSGGESVPGDVVDDDVFADEPADAALPELVADDDPSSATAIPDPVVIAAPKPIATAPAPIQCECRRLVCLGCRAFALRVRRVRDVRFLAMAPSS